MQSLRRIALRTRHHYRGFATQSIDASIPDRKWKLEWSPRNREPPEPPKGFKRDYIETSDGNLELLTTTSKDALESNKPPLFFQHGGFGCADNYIPWMEYFAKRGYPCYALSIRGHGYSWEPKFIQTVYRTTAHMLAQDVASAVKHVTKLHQNDRQRRQGDGFPVVLCHSNGGGLSQMLLDRGIAKASALVILGGTPNFGGFGVYKNWARFDPWFVPRMYFQDLFHPRSPLSKTSLVHRAFFCDEFPRAEVAKFEEGMAPYLSYWWPLEIMKRFVSARKVLSGLTGWGGGRLFVLAGEKDQLMSLNLMGKMAEEYRMERASMAKENIAATNAMDSEKVWGAGDSERNRLGGFEGLRNGIAYRVVEGSGHHIQNDLQKYVAASYIDEWLGMLQRS